MVTGQSIWLSSLESVNYQGGFLPLIAYTQGSFAQIIWPVSIAGAGTLLILTLVFLSFFDKQVFPSARSLTRLLLIAQIIGVLLNVGLANRLQPSLPMLLTNLLLAVVFSYASFRQLASERLLQRGPLQVRLTILILWVTFPIIAFMISFLTMQSSQRIEQGALARLEANNLSLNSQLEQWLDGEIRAYQDVLNQPGLRSLPTSDQSLALQALSDTHPWLNYAGTADLSGGLVASSGTSPFRSISELSGYQQVIGGAETAVHVWDEPATPGSELIIALPIHAPGQPLTGVGLFSISLEALSAQLTPEMTPVLGEALVLDQANRIILQIPPEPTLLGTDISNQAVIAEPQAGSAEPFRYTREDGDVMRAVASSTSYNWTIITQESEASLLAPVRLLHRAAWPLAIGGALIMGFLVWISIRHTLHPIATLSNVADNIAGGNFSRSVPVESEDELGNLAQSMNSMIAQMRGLITNLEQHVAERTQELQHRAIQLQVAADVASESASIHELERVLDHTVHLISERFNFYHTGIFLIDDAGEYAVLRAASSDGGQRMLARRHKLRVGQTGIVGFVAKKGESRVASEVVQDAVYFDNPDMPQTRSEAALPLKVRGVVTGVLDVQSTEAEAFKAEDIQILQVLADQIALAINNARLFDENRQAMDELQSLYSNQVREAWKSQLEDRSIGYVYDRLSVQPLHEPSQASVPGEPEDPFRIEAPIELRGARLGNLSLKRDPNQVPWSQQDRELLLESARQIALALENARLLEETRQRAERERIAGQISTRLRMSNDPQQILQTAVSELKQALHAHKAQALIAPRSPKPDPSIQSSDNPEKPPAETRGKGGNGMNTGGL
ncbi:MAG TPA: GAF domain-containing protein, partial [Anaerolineales bacterium]|nr:GAF domain-containing protein [Anaerolineales bacterium]